MKVLEITNHFAKIEIFSNMITASETNQSNLVCLTFYQFVVIITLQRITFLLTGVIRDLEQSHCLVTHLFE